MIYSGSPQQLKLIFNSMNRLKREKNIKDTEVCSAIEKWVEDTGYPMEPIGLRTYARYRTGGIKDYKRGEMLYKFFCTAPEPFQMISPIFPDIPNITDDHTFVSSIVEKLFPSPTGGYDYGDLKSAVYTYEFYRRSWHVHDGKHFTRSILRIELINGIYRLSEFQRFQVDGKNIEQTDNGFIFPYGSNFFAMTNSENCMKFYDFHEFFPQPSRVSPVDDMKGHLIAVAGPGPHPSYRIFARRAADRAVKPEHLKVDDFKGDSAMEHIIDYIMGKC